MPQAGWECVNTGKNMSFEECFACARTPKHCEFTEPMLRSMRRQVYPRHKFQTSVTRVLGEARQNLIEVTYDYWVSPRRNWAAFRGTLSHRVLADLYGGDAWQELRHTRIVTTKDGLQIPITGAVDRIVPSEGLIQDYKSTVRVPRAGSDPYGNHGLQLNAYRWIWWPMIQCDKLRLIYFDMKGVVQLKVPLMELDEVEEILTEGAEAYMMAAQNDSLPPGKPDSKRWQCGYCDVKHICEELQ